MHGYRSKHSALSRGTQCQACGRRFSTCGRLTVHLRDAQHCLSVVEALQRQGRLQIASGEAGHPQAPPVSTGPACTEPALEVGICHDLLDQLVVERYGDAAGVLEVVCAHVQPLPVLRATLARAVQLSEGSSGGCLLAQVLSTFDAEHLFAGRKVARKEAVAPGFVPVLRSSCFHAARPEGQVIVVGELATEWCLTVQLGQAPQAMREFGDIEPAFSSVAAGLSVLVPSPPLPACPFWSPQPSSVRLCRRHATWCWRLLETLRIAISLADRGAPVCLRCKGLQAQALGSFGDWLLASGASFHEGGSEASCLFHVEFVC